MTTSRAASVSLPRRFVAVVAALAAIVSASMALTAPGQVLALPEASESSAVSNFVEGGPLAPDWLAPTEDPVVGELGLQVAGFLVGGSPAATGEFPWMTYVLIEDRSGQYFRCGGSLIAPLWVLTAAHCVDDAAVVKVITGRTTVPTALNDPAFVVAENVYINSGYEPFLFGVGDVALVKLSVASSAQPLYLARPADSQLYAPGTLATLTGWGLTSGGGQTSSVLLTGELPIRSSAECTAVERGFSSAFNTCAGYLSSEATQPVGSCKGDSGGPLFVRSPATQALTQVGIVSYGAGDCTSLNRPGVYMRVSAFYDGLDEFVGGLPVPPTPSTSPIERWSGADRYATSVVVSQKAFPSGANTVFLATGESFPDALAAGPLAATRNAPILLTATNQLPSAVRSELQRLNPSVIYLLGGPAAIAAEVETQVRAATNGQVLRIAGSDRYATAAAVGLGFETADTVYVATGAGFADALSAGSPGGILGRPVILTSATSVPAASRAQITRFANPNIFVLGGPAAISAAVFAELDALTTGTIRRLDGVNRYATSVAVSSEAFTAADTVFLTTGTAFPDALSAAPAAKLLRAPILLTTAACAPVEVIAEIARLGADRVITLGGSNAVSDAAASLTPCPDTMP
jgi:putative cell wall-binding protein